MQLINRREWSREVLAGALCGRLPLGAEKRRRLVEPKFGPDAIGANTAISGYGLFEAIGLLQRIGFKTIEFHAMGRPQPTPGEFPGIEFAKTGPRLRAKLAEVLGQFKHVTVHLPFRGLRLVSTDKREERAGRDAIMHAMDAAEYFKVQVAVVHCLPPRGMTLAAAWDELLELFRRWGDRAEAGGFRLAIETGYPESVAQFVKLVRDIGHEQVGATIDVGHQIHYAEFRRCYPGTIPAAPEAFKAYNDLMHELIDRLDDKLIHFHVHDIDPVVWREHKPIRYGVIDYPRLFRKLARTGYDGLFVLEIGDEPERMPANLNEARRKLLRWLEQLTVRTAARRLREAGGCGSSVLPGHGPAAIE